MCTLDIDFSLYKTNFRASANPSSGCPVRDGICVDPPLCRGTSQGKYGSRIMALVCKGETVGKIREVDEMGERETVLVVNVKCGKGPDMTRGCQLF